MDMMEWLYEYACGEDCIPGAYYHSHIETWEIIDPAALREYIQDND